MKQTELGVVLSQLPVFAGLNEDAVELLTASMSPGLAAPGDVIVKEGTAASEMFVLIEGLVRVEKSCRAAPDLSLTIAQLGPGECFGEMSLIDIQPRSASIIAEEETQYFRLNNQAFLSLSQRDLHAYTLIIMNIAREISRRLRGADEMISELSSQLIEVTHKVTSALQRLEGGKG